MKYLVFYFSFFVCCNLLSNDNFYKENIFLGALAISHHNNYPECILDPQKSLIERLKQNKKRNKNIENQKKIIQ